jgi:hypothetical protein
MSPARIANILVPVVGCLDFFTGLGLTLVPKQILPLMRVPVPGEEALVYLRFVGVFVMAVGACYLWTLFRFGRERLRTMLELTLLFRLAAGIFSAAAITLNWLAPAWVSVPITDLALAAIQLWLVKKLPQ